MRTSVVHGGGCVDREVGALRTALENGAAEHLERGRELAGLRNTLAAWTAECGEGGPRALKRELADAEQVALGFEAAYERMAAKFVGEQREQIALWGRFARAERAAAYWRRRAESAESRGGALQLWGCWEPGLFGSRYYWVGGRCAAGCHSAVGHLVTDLEMDSLAPADLAGLMGSLARSTLSDLAAAHFAPEPACDADPFRQQCQGTWGFPR